MIVPRTRSFGGNFDILHPDVDELVTTDANGTVFVQVRDNAGFDAYNATINAIGAGSATAPAPVPLTRQGSTNIFSGQVAAGAVPSSPPANDNKTVFVQGFLLGAAQDSSAHDFKAWSGGSGSGSDSRDFLGLVAQRCTFCREDQPAPVALLLQLAAPVRAGTCAGCDRLNQPTLLLHPDDPAYPCSWFSQPLDFCDDSSDPGLWHLEKSDPRTWDLTLRQGNSVVAAYQLTTRADNDCSFPIVLELVAAGSGECEDWPATVTISPA
jgi:hypothetical protein